MARRNITLKLASSIDARTWTTLNGCVKNKETFEEWKNVEATESVKLTDVSCSLGFLASDLFRQSFGHVSKSYSVGHADSQPDDQSVCGWSDGFAGQMVNQPANLCVHKQNSRSRLRHETWVTFILIDLDSKRGVWRGTDVLSVWFCNAVGGFIYMKSNLAVRYSTFTCARNFLDQRAELTRSYVHQDHPRTTRQFWTRDPAQRLCNKLWDELTKLLSFETSDYRPFLSGAPINFPRSDLKSLDTTTITRKYHFHDSYKRLVIFSFLIYIFKRCQRLVSHLTNLHLSYKI